jgi:tryptophan halogenase
VSEARELPRRIVVAGDGPLGVLAAVALKRALPSTEVVVVALPPDPGAFAERFGTALPFSNRLHDRLRISEEDLVRRAGASHRLVTRYIGGGGPTRQGAAGYGAAIDPAMKTAFAREWGGGPRNAETSPPPRSLGEVLAAAGRFAPPPGEAHSPLAELDYALRWHVPAYRALLIDAAEQLGVQHERRTVYSALPDGLDGLVALTLEGGVELAADLFVDCSGSGAMLLSKLAQAEWIDLGRRLPARILAIGAPGGGVLALEDRMTLTPAGWRWEIGGRDGLQAVLALVHQTPDPEIEIALGTEPVEYATFVPTRARAPWIGNVVALGDAATRFEPLGGVAQDLAHRQLALLLELLPGREIDPTERAEFNRRAGLMAERACDWLAAHYAAPAAAALVPGLERSPELARTLDQFARRGRLPFAEEAPMLPQEFGALLQALGMPQGEGPLAAAGSAEDGARAFEARAAAALHAAPPYGEWMQRVLVG